MSPEEKKNLRYTVAALGLTAIVGGAMAYFSRDIYNHFSPPHPRAPRALSSKEIKNVQDSTVFVEAYDPIQYWGYYSDGTSFEDTQTGEMYVLTNYVDNTVLTTIKINGFSGKVVKSDHDKNLSLIKLNHCVSCLPHYEGKIALSTEKGDKFICAFDSGKIITLGEISAKHQGAFGTLDYVLVNSSAGFGTSCTTTDYGKMEFIGKKKILFQNSLEWGLTPIEELRSFIKGTPLEDELL